MISCKNISKTFSSGLTKKELLKAVDHVSLDIKKGTTFGLMGLSGSGKSTIGRLILGLESLSEGDIWIEGKSLKEWLTKDSLQFRKNCQILFQFPQETLHPQFTIKESMYEVFKIHNDLSGNKDALVEEALHEVGLDVDVLLRKPNQMSGGQLQRLCLARILLLHPKFIVLDEPTTMLDSMVQMQVIDLLKKIQVERNLTYLYVSHDLDLIKYMSDYVGVMKNGQLIECDTTEKIFHEPKEAFTKHLFNEFYNF